MVIPNQHTFSVSETAKHCRFPGGEKKFFQYLRDHAFLMNEKNEPYQKWLDMGLFIYTAVTLHKTKNKKVIMVPRVTIKGLEYLEKMVWNEFYKCKPCADATSNKP